MSKIILVNPPLSAEERYGVKSFAGGQTPPLGLAHLAAMTRLHGYETEILDAAALGMGEKSAVNSILESKPRYVGFTGATVAFQHIDAMAKTIKDADPSISILIGGPHFTAVPEESMQRCKALDVGVMGEADYALVELLSAMEQNKYLGDVQGIIYRQNGNLVSTGLRPPVLDLDALPMPAWDLLPDLAKYYCPPVHTLKKFPAALLIASRSYPGKCTFCASQVFGKELRAYSAEYTLRMIKDLYDNYGIREIQLRDDNFLAYRRRMVELCELLIKEKLDLVWTCAGRVDMVNPDLLKLMKKAGCWQIWYGVESGSQEILTRIKKFTTIEKIEKATRMTADAGISACGFFMFGSPGETRETMQQTVDLAMRLPLDEAHFAYVTPLPGAELFTTANEFGTFDDEWNRLNGWTIVFVPKGLKKEDLEEFSKKAFRKFYFRPRIVFSYLKKMRSWAHFKAYTRGFIALIQHLFR